MSTLNFADTHNMVAFLSKPAESEGFEKIVKTINGEVQLQALVDGKKVIITEAIVRRDLQLEDVEGVECLPNATIFKELTRMGAKTTAWNEFSSTMASAVICLTTNQKFNFSKYIFESMVKNSENEGKFLMYSRFIQVFLDKQVEGMQSHKKIYEAPCHTKKIFANMRRQGKDFSGRVTPLFQTMVVQAQAEMGEGSAHPTNPHHTPIIQPSTSQPQRKQKPRRQKRKDTKIPQSRSLDAPGWARSWDKDPDEFEAPQSPEQAPPSPDYVPDPEYPKYLAPSDDEIPVEDQTFYPSDALPTARSPGYVADSDPLEEGTPDRGSLADYLTDG
ncbi:hypothetical protein Tco_1246378 [Tanacetum coccineum]